MTERRSGMRSATLTVLLTVVLVVRIHILSRILFLSSNFVLSVVSSIVRHILVKTQFVYQRH